jgi:peptide/nickel transport system permease protein
MTARVGILRASAALLLVVAAVAFLGPVLVGHDPMRIDLGARYAPPLSAGHLLGCDQLGRDVAARLVTGLRWSLAIAAGATSIAFVLGTLVGLLAARSRALVGTALRQVTIFTQSFPVFVLAVAVVAVIGNSGFTTLVLTLGLVTWPVFARVVQAEASSLLTREYVLAADMMQMGTARLLLRHVLPGLVPSLSVLLVFHFADMIIAESALSFLGIGAPLGAATWGGMLNESRAHMLAAPWMLLAPAAAIVLLVVGAHALGQRLRDAAS